MEVCFQLVYNRADSKTKTQRLLPPRLRGIIPLACFFCWFLCANDSQIIWKFVWHSNVAYPQHLALKVSVGRVLVGVSPYGRCAVLAHLLLIAKIAKKSHKIMISRYVSRFEYVYCQSFEWGKTLTFGNDRSGGLIKKIQPTFILFIGTPKNTIAIPFMISYITWLQRWKIAVWVVTSNLQTSIQLDLSKIK